MLSLSVMDINQLGKMLPPLYMNKVLDKSIVHVGKVVINSNYNLHIVNRLDITCPSVEIINNMLYYSIDGRRLYMGHVNIRDDKIIAHKILRVMLIYGTYVSNDELYQIDGNDVFFISYILDVYNTLCTQYYEMKNNYLIVNNDYLMHVFSDYYIDSNEQLWKCSCN